MNHLSSSNATITVVNAPLVRTNEQLLVGNAISGFSGVFIFSIALAFKFASIASFIVKERSTRAKHQQIVSGMNIASYWFGNFIYDYLLYAIIAGVSIGIAVGLDVEILTEGDALAATCILFFLYGTANIPLTYIFGFIFTDYGNAQVGVFFFNFILGGLITIIILVLRLISNIQDDVPSSDVGRGLSWFLRIFPAFSFGEGTLVLSVYPLFEITEKREYEVFSLEVTLAPIIYLAAFTIIYFILLFWI